LFASSKFSLHPAAEIKSKLDYFLIKVVASQTFQLQADVFLVIHMTASNHCAGTVVVCCCYKDLH